MRQGGGDASAETFVQAHPWVEQFAVGAPPRDVTLDRRERIAVLPRRADGCDKTMQAVTASKRVHAGQQLGGQAALAGSRSDFGGEGAEGVNIGAVAAGCHGALQGVVDASG